MSDTAASGLVVRGLRAAYGGRTVLHDLDLDVAPGEIVCLLGANGAGKTTALGAMTGLVRATGGTVALDGVVLRLGAPDRIARTGLAHVPEDRSLFPSLTVAEHLRLAAPRRRRRSGGGAEVDVTALFPALEPLLATKVGLLSGGEQQMVAIGRALVARPRMLLIDEMSLGLAPIVVRSLFDGIAHLAADTGCGVLLVEQHVGLALDVADRAYVLRRGRIVAHGRAADLAADHDGLVANYLGQAPVGSSTITVIDS